MHFKLLYDRIDTGKLQYLSVRRYFYSNMIVPLIFHTLSRPSTLKDVPKRYAFVLFRFKHMTN